MKSTQKGNQYEKEVKLILQAKGWHVEGQHRKVMFLGPGKMIMAGRDIYGCDLICKKQGEKTLWIQVSTIENKSKKEKQVKEFPWTLEHESLQLWLRVKGAKKYRVYEAKEEAGSTSFVEIGTESLRPSSS
jgi:hypothetical protein